MVRVFCDFHHSSLLRSMYLTFEERLGMMVYRPIGMEWFDHGYWAINGQRDTAEQFLHPGSIVNDGTPALNEITRERNELLGETPANGFYSIEDPGGGSYNRGITLEAFKNTRFDYLIATLPQHIDVFRNLIREYQPWAKLIVQAGNNWSMELFSGCNVLASMKQERVPADVNALFYHQEFDTEIFHPEQVSTTGNKIYSFVNILENHPLAWSDFTGLESALAPHGFEMRAYGGQCRDGNMTGPFELADRMRQASMIFHVKEGGDGFGHIIYNAYACGRPIVTRRRFYKGKLAEELLQPGTFIDLDECGLGAAALVLTTLHNTEEGRAGLQEMGDRAASAFNSMVDYQKEAENIRLWLETIK